MNRDDILRMAKMAGLTQKPFCRWGGYLDDLMRFAALVAAAEREKVARWIIHKGYATGHGDTIDDLLKELEWQVAEREREACATVCDARVIGDHNREDQEAKRCAAAIRARGEV